MSGFDDKSTGSEFDWRRDADDVVIREQLAIAVYENPAGDLVIRQADWPDDDSIIIVAKSNAAALARAILRAAGQIEVFPELLGSPFDGASKGDRPKDPTAAARQKRYRERNADRNGRNGNGVTEHNGAPRLALLANGAAE